MTDQLDSSPQHEDPVTTPTADVESIPPAESSRPAWLIPLATGVAGFILGILVVGGTVGITTAVAASNHSAQVHKASAATKAILSTALHKCNLADGADTTLGDGGYTLTVNNQGNTDASGISYDDLACLEKAMKTPASVLAHIGQTTSMDGRQTESWGKVTMSWSYHPDRGLDAVYTASH